MDILAALREYHDAANDAGQLSMPSNEGCAAIPRSVLALAIAEIAHLRGLAGAVSAGSSFAELRGGMNANPVLKAFDGA